MYKKLFLLGGLTALVLIPLFSFAQTEEFVPLTNLPGIREIGSSSTLPAFLNNLYRLCIGAAAVIAILQIMRAGTYFMFNKGSVARNEKGKSLIANSILGLLLVLSPAIVFGIINPDILDLRLNFSGIRVADLPREQQQDCRVYTSKEAVRSDDGTNRCAAGSTLIPNQCCSAIRSNEICCGRVGTTQYLLAYTFERRLSNGTTCRTTPRPTYYATLGAGARVNGSTETNPGCDVESARAFVASNPVYSNFQVLRGCVAVTNTNYSVPQEFENTCP